MDTWKDCIVLYMDLIGTTKRALAKGSAASAIMREFHKVVLDTMESDLLSLNHAYVWNDAVLLVANVDHQFLNAMRAADALKRRIDATARCYAIAVKGRTFPTSTEGPSTRVTILRTSSYAMANCFRVEEVAKLKNLRKDWYVDARIAKRVAQAKSTSWITVRMLPGGGRRRIYTHQGYLWN